MSTSEHQCDERCVCPDHGTPLLYWPLGDDHACRDKTCQYAHGVEPATVWAERMIREGRSPWTTW